MFGGVDRLRRRPRPKPAPTRPTAPAPSAVAGRRGERRRRARWSENDATDTGIRTTFKFASPANQQATGPDRAVHPAGAERGLRPAAEPQVGGTVRELAVKGDQATEMVTVIDAAGNVAHYVFQLSKQHDDGAAQGLLDDRRRHPRRAAGRHRPDGLRRPGGSGQVRGDEVGPLGVEGPGVHGGAGPPVPVAGVGRVALLAVQVGVQPVVRRRPLPAWATAWAAAQSPLASCHRACRIGPTPAGGGRVANGGRRTRWQSLPLPLAFRRPDLNHEGSETRGRPTGPPAVVLDADPPRLPPRVETAAAAMSSLRRAQFTSAPPSSTPCPGTASSCGTARRPA